MKIILLSCMAASLLFGAACKKSTDTPIPVAQHYTIDSLALSYLKLPIGTYYVYRDSASGLTDTVTVNKSELKTVFLPGHNSTSSFMGIGFTQQIPDIYYDSLIVHLTKESYQGNQNWLLFEHLQVYPSMFFHGTDNDDGGSLIPSISIEGNTYTNVLRFVSSSGSDTNATYYNRVEYYWAKGVGIIKRSITKAHETHCSTLMRTWK